MRLIDADAYSAEMKQRQEACKEWFFRVEDRELENRAIGTLNAFIEAKLTLDSMPTVDAVPVRHGMFIGTEYDGYADGYPVYYEWKCSECGCIFEDEEPTYKYCPNCGCRMDERKEDVAK